VSVTLRIPLSPNSRVALQPEAVISAALRAHATTHLPPRSRALVPVALHHRPRVSGKPPSSGHRSLTTGGNGRWLFLNISGVMKSKNYSSTKNTPIPVQPFCLWTPIFFKRNGLKKEMKCVPSRVRIPSRCVCKHHRCVLWLDENDPRLANRAPAHKPAGRRRSTRFIQT